MRSIFRTAASMDDVLDQIAAMYTRSLEKHGCTAEGVGWGNPEKHLTRLEKLTAGFDENTPPNPLTINDLGCGYGSLFTYLDALDTIDVESYHGYDISSDMIEAAEEQIGTDRATFYQSDTLQTTAHFTFASGIFNVKMDACHDAWQRHVEQTLRQMAEYSSHGIMFNSLSTYVDWKEDHLYYGDPSYFIDFCATNLSRKVVLLHDYELYEWTMIVCFES